MPRSIRAIAETGLLAKAVKAGDTAPYLDADHTTRLEPSKIIV